MSTASLTFLGSGDAFGTGGRYQTCMLVRAASHAFLIDCGASSLVATRRFGVNPNDIEMILLTHLHGDHFGGVPFFILDGQLVSKRTRPLRVAGPPGTRRRIEEAMEVLFPGSSRVERRFAVEILELEAEQNHAWEGMTVTPYPVSHPSGAPPFALRVSVAEKVLAYTGDTEWCPSLVAAGRDADLLVAEAYTYDRPVKFHLNWQILKAHLDEIRPRRVVLTHMSGEMLERAAAARAAAGMLDGITVELAEDGQTVTF